MLDCARCFHVNCFVTSWYNECLVFYWARRVHLNHRAHISLVTWSSHKPTLLEFIVCLLLEVSLGIYVNAIATLSKRLACLSKALAIWCRMPRWALQHIQWRLPRQGPTWYIIYFIQELLRKCNSYGVLNLTGRPFWTTSNHHVPNAVELSRHYFSQILHYYYLTDIRAEIRVLTNF